ncbi:hypothetical protein RHMOL_Rhmol04G0163800 [Rhododendron molle]|uniref:Uncharacterized protein n=1 Tax=Rhododendron molle TaxID=49168 RepID=A0ACC0P3M0_RHOML|nr:hypothetical protein RHMOL_Rhmol04G0163800 [Rhododendron molle]
MKVAWRWRSGWAAASRIWEISGGDGLAAARDMAAIRGFQGGSGIKAWFWPWGRRAGAHGVTEAARAFFGGNNNQRRSDFEELFQRRRSVGGGVASAEGQRRRQQWCFQF